MHPQPDSPYSSPRHSSQPHHESYERVPAHQTAYELTFKKQIPTIPTQEHPHRKDQLFDRETVTHPLLERPIRWFVEQSVDELSELPWAELYALELSEEGEEKLVGVGEVLELKRLRQRVCSVGVNLRCMSAK